MSDQELTRLRVMIDLGDDRLTVDSAATLMGLSRRQIYRLRQTFAADGPAGLASRKRGRPSNRKHGPIFRATVLRLVREHYIDFGPTLAAEKLMAGHALRIGVETLRQWMMADGLWVDRRHRLPSPHQRDDGVNVWANSSRSTVPNTAGSSVAARSVLCWRSSTTRPAD